MSGTVAAYGGAVFVGLTFISLVKILRVFEAAPRVMAVSTHVLRDLRDPRLDDSAKETRMRQHARVLARLFVRIFGAALTAIAAPLGAVWLLDAGGIVSFDRVLDVLSSWPMLLGGTLVGIAQLWPGKRCAT